MTQTHDSPYVDALGLTRVAVTRGLWAHYIYADDDGVALCGYRPRLTHWLGTGDYGEFDVETLYRLPVCLRCAHHLGKHEDL